MMSALLQAWKSMSVGHLLIDALDIIVVAFLIYRGLLVLKGTRALQMGFGVVLVMLTYAIARWIGLVTLENLFSYLLSSIILVIIVVFQNDIRRALMRIGSAPIMGAWGQSLETQVVDEVVAATTELAKHRTGALIAFEQDATLDEFVVGQGITIDAAVSRDLLVTMFIPESMNKLHDGAVVIRNLRISRAGVFFPMPEAKNIDAAYGSRHRAALGITEETDAVVIVVSEERGTISFCFNGNLVTNLNSDVLRKTLLRIFGKKPSNPARGLTQKLSFNRKHHLEPLSNRTPGLTPPPSRTAQSVIAPKVTGATRSTLPVDLPRNSTDISSGSSPMPSISDTLLSVKDISTPMVSASPLPASAPAAELTPPSANSRSAAVKPASELLVSGKSTANASEDTSGDLREI